MKKYWVYIICNKRNGTLYVGMTNNISRRIYEHKERLFEGFSKKYGLDKLVFVQQFEDVSEAIVCEKKLKKWKRSWKISLIEEGNPDWEDLGLM
mgnify:CR=1 FL=1